MISVAAELSGLHPQTLRTYERMGLITPGRTPGGGRRYSYRDIEHLRVIAELTSSGIGIEGVRRILELESAVATLRAQRDELLAELDAAHEALRQAHRRPPRVQRQPPRRTPPDPAAVHRRLAPQATTTRTKSHGSLAKSHGSRAKSHGVCSRSRTVCSSKCATSRTKLCDLADATVSRLSWGQALPSGLSVNVRVPWGGPFGGQGCRRGRGAGLVSGLGQR